MIADWLTDGRTNRRTYRPTDQQTGRMINKGRKEWRKGLQSHLPWFCSNFSPCSAHYSLFCLSCWPQHIHSFLKVTRAQSSSQPCWCLVSRAALRPLHDRRAHTGFDLSQLFDDFQKRKEKTFNPATLSSVRLVFKWPSSWLEAKVNTMSLFKCQSFFRLFINFVLYKWREIDYDTTINIILTVFMADILSTFWLKKLQCLWEHRVLNTYLDFFGGFSSSESKKKNNLNHFTCLKRYNIFQLCFASNFWIMMLDHSST